MKRVKLQEAVWTADQITRAVIHSQFFQRKLLVVPRCTWPGHECDLLAVHAPSLRILDLEIKISRQDLLADPKKDKWWEGHFPVYDKELRQYVQKPRVRLEWPPNVWKHYYVMPDAVWRSGDLGGQLPAKSGVIIFRRNGSGLFAWVAKHAQPNKKAQPIQPADVMDLARLAGLRMWDALLKLETR